MSVPRYLRPGLEFAADRAVEEVGELMEALGRLLAALGKTGRWGWHGTNPELPPAKQETNADWVRREMKDVREALDNLQSEMEQNLMSNLERNPAVGQRWQHYKGGLYKIVSIGRDEPSGEPVVIYNDTGSAQDEVWVRTREAFLSFAESKTDRDVQTSSYRFVRFD